MTAYYNEIDPFAAAWLRQLIFAGHIAPGDVDTRSIVDVRPDDLRGYTQCHFFAGIGVWSHALRLAGWPDDRPVWTGSCPCQPFSAAGKGGGFDDERHLWPHFHWLISQCGPSVVLGEQVASKDGLAWLDLVQADLEGSGYAAGAVDLCAAGVGAPHIRQRLWWVAERILAYPDRSGSASFSGDTGEERSIQEAQRQPEHGATLLGRSGGPEWLADATSRGPQHEPSGEPAGVQSKAPGNQIAGAEPSGYGASLGERPGPTNGLWRDADWLGCRDGKWRPVEPGTFPLAHGSPARVGRLRGYGNAIVAPAAQAFIEAVQDTLYPAIDIRLTDLSEMTNDRKDIFA